MTKFLVLFDRQYDDEVYEARGIIQEGDSFSKVTKEQRFEQLRDELNEFGDGFELELTGYIEPQTDSGQRVVLLVSVKHEGDTPSLCKRLQHAYDENGVEGYFEITMARL